MASSPLESPQDHTAALLDTVQALVVVLASDGRIRLFNRACEETTGYRASEVVGRRPWEILVAPEDRELERQAFESLRSGRLPTHRESTWICKDGRRRDLAWSSALAVPAGREIEIIDTGVDVTEQNLASAAMQRSRDDLDRMRDEFLGVAAHELKTPIAIIKAYAQMLTPFAREGGLPQRAIEAICRGVDRVDALVNDLLLMSQLQLGGLQLHLEPFDLTELVKSECARAAAQHRSLELRVDTGDPVIVTADRARVGQVVSRLLANAVKYSIAPARVVAGVLKEPDRAIVFVRDQGIGIPADRQARIFSRFYRAHADTEHDSGGIGVGLYLARQVLHALGGRIWFESGEGQGSRFSFSLPLRRPFD